MKCQQGYAPTGLPIVLMEDPTCPCHRDIELLAAVAEAVAQGRLTQEEATQVIAGTRGLSA